MQEHCNDLSLPGTPVCFQYYDILLVPPGVLTELCTDQAKCIFPFMSLNLVYPLIHILLLDAFVFPLILILSLSHIFHIHLVDDLLFYLSVYMFFCTCSCFTYFQNSNPFSVFTFFETLNLV